MYALRKELSEVLVCIEVMNSRHSMQLYQEQMHKDRAEHHSRAHKVHTVCSGFLDQRQRHHQGF